MPSSSFTAVPTATSAVSTMPDDATADGSQAVESILRQMSTMYQSLTGVLDHQRVAELVQKAWEKRATAHSDVNKTKRRPPPESYMSDVLRPIAKGSVSVTANESGHEVIVDARILNADFLSSFVVPAHDNIRDKLVVAIMKDTFPNDPTELVDMTRSAVEGAAGKFLREAIMAAEDFVPNYQCLNPLEERSHVETWMATREWEPTNEQLHPKLTPAFLESGSEIHSDWLKEDGVLSWDDVAHPHADTVRSALLDQLTTFDSDKPDARKLVPGWKTQDILGALSGDTTVQYPTVLFTASVK
ncbi:hypothetical protein Q5752_001274 [Cryptotrichosporon argae]